MREERADVTPSLISHLTVLQGAIQCIANIESLVVQ